MLKPIKAAKTRAVGASVAIVASLYNARYVAAMLRAAKIELKRGGIRKVQVIRVPGAFEIPVVAARLARLGSPFASRIAHHGASPSAIICLGVILRGRKRR